MHHEFGVLDQWFEITMTMTNKKYVDNLRLQNLFSDNRCSLIWRRPLDVKSAWKNGNNEQPSVNQPVRKFTGPETLIQCVILNAESKTRKIKSLTWRTQTRIGGILRVTLFNPRDSALFPRYVHTDESQQNWPCSPISQSIFNLFFLNERKFKGLFPYKIS